MASDLESRRGPTDAADELAAFAAFIAAARAEREARGLSLTEVARRMGCDHAAVSRLESGKQANPTVNTVMRSVEAIGLRVAWGLAERDDAPIPRGDERARLRLRGRPAAG